MSVHLFYQALPEHSPLFARLQTEARLYTLYNYLISYGSGPFGVTELDPKELRLAPEELAEILKGLAQSERGQQVFGTPEAVQQTLEELRQELRAVCVLHPGIAFRAAMMEQTDAAIYEYLSEFLKTNGQEDAISLLPSLFYGEDACGDEKILRPPEVTPEFGDLRLVSAVLVRQGATLLRPLPAEILFAQAEEDIAEWLGEDYDSWRTVYLQAAQHEEVIVVA